MMAPQIPSYLLIISFVLKHWKSAIQATSDPQVL